MPNAYYVTISNSGQILDTILKIPISYIISTVLIAVIITEMRGRTCTTWTTSDCEVRRLTTTHYNWTRSSRTAWKTFDQSERVSRAHGSAAGCGSVVPTPAATPLVINYKIVFRLEKSKFYRGRVTARVLRSNEILTFDVLENVCIRRLKKSFCCCQINIDTPADHKPIVSTKVTRGLKTRFPMTDILFSINLEPKMNSTQFYKTETHYFDIKLA
ncbi:hypothetical protein QTP88_025957 [Uroleucon formosanum]